MGSAVSVATTVFPHTTIAIAFVRYACFFRLALSARTLHPHSSRGVRVLVYRLKYLFLSYWVLWRVGRTTKNYSLSLRLLASLVGKPNCVAVSLAGDTQTGKAVCFVFPFFVFSHSVVRFKQHFLFFVPTRQSNIHLQLSRRCI